MATPLKLLAGAEVVVGEAAAKLVAMQTSSLRAKRKDLLDIVTEADLAAEEIVVKGLLRLTPGAAILAEESGEGQGSRSADGGRWIIDPLDGTVNYACGLPWFSVTVAYEQAGQVQLGLVHAPKSGLHARYLRDQIATIDGTSALVSTRSALADSVISVCLTSHFSPDETRRTIAIIDALARAARGVRVVVSGGLEMSLVAAGRMDGFVSIKADVVSHATGMALIRAGGGRVTTVEGSNSRIDDLQKICSNGLIHDELLKLVQKAAVS